MRKWIALEKLSRTVVCVFIPSQYLTQLWEVKGQSFAKSEIFDLTCLHFKNYSSEKKLFRRFPCSILNRMACCFGLPIEYSWCIAFRNGTTTPSPEFKLGQLPWLTSETGKMSYKLVYVKTNHKFDLRNSGNPKTIRLVATGKHVVCKSQWPADDLRKVRMRCRRADDLCTSVSWLHATFCSTKEVWLFCIVCFPAFLHRVCKWEASMIFGCWAMNLSSGSCHDPVNANVPCCVIFSLDFRHPW